ncbi:2-methoxy-6-polyprenyl-1,4-benzoquinol methylase, mitochondrial [subsurface metagenome]
MMRYIEKLFLRSPLRVNHLIKKEAPKVLAHLPLLKNGDCLEIGSGYGHGAYLIKHYTGCKRVIGIDNDPEIVSKSLNMLNRPPRWAKHIGKGGIKFVEGNAENISFQDESFDAVIHFFALCHIPRWQKAISEIYRILKPEGVFSFEDKLFPDNPLLFNSYFGHVPISADQLKETLIKAGFTIERFEVGSWLRPCFVTARKYGK